MAATKLQFNWTAVGFTPTAGSLTTFTKVKSVSIDPGGTLTGFEADGDKYPTVIINAFNAPKVSFQSGDIATMQGFASGAIGTFTATHSDAKGGSSGAIVYTMVNAVIENMPSQGQHRNFGMATMTFQAYSSDGTTNPLTFTRA